MAQFPDWLSRLSSTGQRLDFPHLRLGTVYSVELLIGEHPILEDWTGGDFAMQAKASPGAATALISFNISAGVPNGGTTPVTILADAVAQGDVTAPDEAGVSELYYDIVFTPTGLEPVLVCGGLLPIIAAVTE